MVRLVLIVLSSLLFGCKNSNDPTLKAVKDTLGKTYDEAKEGVSALTPKVHEITSEELEKLFTFEYQILEFPSSTSREALTEKLAFAGKERWEAYAVETREGATRVYLKRRPSSYLRYIPRFFP